MRSLPKSLRVARGVGVNKKRKTFMRDGALSLLIAIALSGYGFFRYPERPILGSVLMVVGLMNMLVSGANFGLAIWGGS